jgi:hypothetical protein
MWHFIFVPFLLVIIDYFKTPIDRLYFQRALRPFIGMRNTLVDMIMYKPFYDVDNYFGLWRVRLNFKEIYECYNQHENTVEKHYFHDMDAWFPKNENYYYHKLEDLPEIYEIVKSIPCVESGMIAVMDGPITIAPHRAESNMLLRYHLTIKGTSTLDTDYELHEHTPGQEFLFDHSRYHKVDKTSSDKRVVLILDVKRF